MKKLLFILFLILPLLVFSQKRLEAEFRFSSTTTPVTGTYGMLGTFTESDQIGYTVDSILVDTTKFQDINGNVYLVKAKTVTSAPIITLEVDAVGHSNTPAKGLGQLFNPTYNYDWPLETGGVDTKNRALSTNEFRQQLDSLLLVIRNEAAIGVNNVGTNSPIDTITVSSPYSPLTPLHFNGTSWEIASNHSSQLKFAWGIVVDSINATTVGIQSIGFATIIGHGLTVGELYSLDSLTYTLSSNIDSTQYDQWLWNVSDANTIDIKLSSQVEPPPGTILGVAGGVTSSELADSTAAIRADYPYDSTVVVQDSIIVTYLNGAEENRDTFLNLDNPGVLNWVPYFTGPRTLQSDVTLTKDLAIRNLYDIDGTTTGNRTITLGTNTLDFDNNVSRSILNLSNTGVLIGTVSDKTFFTHRYGNAKGHTSPFLVDGQEDGTISFLFRNTSTGTSAKYQLNVTGSGGGPALGGNSSTLAVANSYTGGAADIYLYGPSGTNDMYFSLTDTSGVFTFRIQDSGTGQEQFQIGQDYFLPPLRGTANLPTSPSIGMNVYNTDTDSPLWYSTLDAQWWSPVKTSLSGGDFTTGSFPFAESDGGLTENNSKLFWSEPDESFSLGSNTIVSESFTTTKMGFQSINTFNYMNGSLGIGTTRIADNNSTVRLAVSPLNNVGLYVSDNFANAANGGVHIYRNTSASGLEVIHDQAIMPTNLLSTAIPNHTRYSNTTASARRGGVMSALVHNTKVHPTGSSVAFFALAYMQGNNNEIGTHTAYLSANQFATGDDQKITTVRDFQASGIPIPITAEVTTQYQVYLPSLNNDAGLNGNVVNKYGVYQLGDSTQNILQGSLQVGDYIFDNFQDTTGLDGQVLTYDASDNKIRLKDPAELGFTIDTESTTTINAVAYTIHPTDVSSGIATVNPPGSPTDGVTWFAISDSRANAATNNITIDFNTAGDNFHGQAATNYVMNTDAEYKKFLYINSAIGWIIAN